MKAQQARLHATASGEHAQSPSGSRSTPICGAKRDNWTFPARLCTDLRPRLTSLLLLWWLAIGNELGRVRDDAGWGLSGRVFVGVWSGCYGCFVAFWYCVVCWRGCGL